MFATLPTYYNDKREKFLSFVIINRCSIALGRRPYFKFLFKYIHAKKYGKNYCSVCAHALCF